MSQAEVIKLDLNRINWESGDGLIPAIVQHAHTGTVLMLAYMNRQALQESLTRRRVTFFSRSRQQLWQKGDTSGHYLQLVDVQVDCDGDTLLVQALPNGPACHKGTATCFGDHTLPQIGFLGQLQHIIEGRRVSDPADSYTSNLLHQPVSRIAQKLGEESIETVVAAVAESENALVEEAADLIYHLMVLCASRNIELSDVAAQLQRRHQSTS